MEIIESNERTGRKPRILVLGSTGRTGKAVIAELEQRSVSFQVVYSSRNRGQAAAEIAKALQQPIECVVLTPDDLVAQIRSGAVQLPASVEANYGASMLEWVRQTYDGRLDFGAVTTSAVEDLTGRKPLTLRAWIERYRESVLAVGAQA